MKKTKREGAKFCLKSLRSSVAAAVFVFVVVLGIATARVSAAEGRQGRFQAGGGVGLTFNSPINPSIRFDLNLNGGYFFWDKILVGLDLDFLFRGPTAVVFMPFARYHFDLDFAPRWVPYVGGGIGGAFDFDGGGALDVMIPNFGFQYEVIDDKLFVGTDMSTHIVTNFDHANFDFRWLLATVAFRF